MFVSQQNTRQFSMPITVTLITSENHKSFDISDICDFDWKFKLLWSKSSAKNPNHSLAGILGDIVKFVVNQRNKQVGIKKKLARQENLTGTIFEPTMLTGSSFPFAFQLNMMLTDRQHSNQYDLKYQNDYTFMHWQILLSLFSSSAGVQSNNPFEGRSREALMDRPLIRTITII